MAPMETSEILRQLAIPAPEFPRAAIEAALEKREEITAHLLRILVDTADRAAELSSKDDYGAHLMPCSCWRSSAKPALTRSLSALHHSARCWTRSVATSLSMTSTGSSRPSVAAISRAFSP